MWSFVNPNDRSDDRARQIAAGATRRAKKSLECAHRRANVGYGGARIALAAYDDKIIDILQSVDSTFQPRRNGYSAVSDTGFVVDLIKAEKKVPWTDDSLSLSEGDLVASPIRALTWLVTSPKVETVAVDERGYPVPIVAPDPRCFAIYKHWLATECRDRDPVKRSRDLAQSRGIAALVQQRLPHMPFNARQMRMFPLAIVKAMEVDSGEDTNVFLPGPGR